MYFAINVVVVSIRFSDMENVFQNILTRMIHSTVILNGPKDGLS